MRTQNQPTNSSKRYVRTPGASERLGCAAQTLERWRTEGGGPPFVRLSPKIVVYDIADLDAWCEARKVASTSDVRSAK